jgi:hypothetical protein
MVAYLSEVYYDGFDQEAILNAAEPTTGSNIVDNVAGLY